MRKRKVPRKVVKLVKGTRAHLTKLRIKYINPEDKDCLMWPTKSEIDRLHSWVTKLYVALHLGKSEPEGHRYFSTYHGVEKKLGQDLGLIAFVEELSLKLKRLSPIPLMAHRFANGKPGDEHALQCAFEAVIREFFNPTDLSPANYGNLLRKISAGVSQIWRDQEEWRIRHDPLIEPSLCLIVRMEMVKQEKDFRRLFCGLYPDFDSYKVELEKAKNARTSAKNRKKS